MSEERAASLQDRAATGDGRSHWPYDFDLLGQYRQFDTNHSWEAFLNSVHDGSESFFTILWLFLAGPEPQNHI